MDILNRNGNVLQAFQVGYHWPQCEANVWFHKAVLDHVFILHNMGKMHDPSTPPSIDLHLGETVLTAVQSDWVIKSNAEFLVVSDSDFSKEYTIM